MINVEEMNEGPVVKDLDSMVEFAEGGIVSKVFLNRPETSMTLFCMAKGQELSEHTSTKPAAIHILRGKGTVRLGGEIIEAAPGKWIFMPPQQLHSLQATEDMVFLLTLFKRF